jgi:transcriptional regulator with XRE-family HTH domain
MTGKAFKAARERERWTQHEAAERLGTTQAYVSMVEQGRRPVSRKLAAKAVRTFRLSPAELPLVTGAFRGGEAFENELAALGYPGFSQLKRKGKVKRNPVQLFAAALNQANLPARVVEAFPWLAFNYADMDWDWLVEQMKLHDRQNRLGYVVSVALQLANETRDLKRADVLKNQRDLLEPSRLVREDTLCRDSMTLSERRWLQHHRLTEARHWNLLTDLELKNLDYGVARA